MTTEVFHKTMNRKHTWASEQMGTNNFLSLSLSQFHSPRNCLCSILIIKPNIAASDLNSHNFLFLKSLGPLRPPFQNPERNHLIDPAHVRWPL